MLRALPSLQRVSLQCAEPACADEAIAALVIGAFTDLKGLEHLEMRVGLKPGPIFTALAPRVTVLSIRLSPGSGAPPFGDDASLQPLSRLTALRELTVYGTEADMARASSAALVIDRARLGRILGGRLPPHLTRLALRLCAILRPPPPPGGGRAAPATRHSLAFSFAAGKLTAVELPPAPAPGPAADPAALPELELAELGTLCKVLMDSRAMGPRLQSLDLGCRLETGDHMPHAVRDLVQRCDVVGLASLAAATGPWDTAQLVQLLGWPRYLHLSPRVPPLSLGEIPEPPPHGGALASGRTCFASLLGRSGFTSLGGPGDLLAMATRRLAAAGAAEGWPHTLRAEEEGHRVVVLLRGPDLMSMAREEGWRAAGAGQSREQQTEALVGYTFRLSQWLRKLEVELEEGRFAASLPLPEAGGAVLSCSLGALWAMVHAARRGDPRAAVCGSAARVVPTVLAAGVWPGAPEVHGLLEAAAAQVLQAVWDGVEEGSGLRWGRAERLMWTVDTWVAARAQLMGVRVL
ncbi:hypothetical protein HYH03_002110 [Edaphochlamys debaryana]|uniref:Uncharacterized protein n=1 Tax=Edaphochlamys debaryana TaxID=47281 RepID=A0A835YBV7_9CHLO|nr:hypothetical protein HYH03_002110 [Edaphochlamys debaryana]|eukprot:KAG2499818.1 hypothetical protein HYH03_002110 [Edaphochlamys debaryana]